MPKSKVALITGITGQDGSYLAKFLLNKNYVVHGLRRRTSSFNTERIDYLYNDEKFKEVFFSLHYGDMTDSLNIMKIIQKTKPDEIYNLAAQSHVHVSFQTPEYTANVDALGCLRILDCIKTLELNNTKFYQASTSELYGDVLEVPQNEDTAFNPQSPYAVAKLYAYWITKNYRNSYNLFASNGILFNHESPVRGETFVTRKITQGLCKIKLGMQKCLYMGNIYAERDWGHAKDYAEAQWLILQHDEADDFVISTGNMYSVKQFIELAAKYLELEIYWKGEGIDEKGINKTNGETIVAIDEKYFRPSEVSLLKGDSSKAKELLGWTSKTCIETLVREMVDHDMNILKK